MNKKQYPNPYLYLLWERMFRFEVGFFFKRVTAKTAAQYFSVVHSKPRTKELFKKKIEEFSKSNMVPTGPASTFERLWERSDFKIPYKQLDLCVQAIRFLGNFESWSDFVDQEKKGFSLERYNSRHDQAGKFNRYIGYSFEDLEQSEFTPGDLTIREKIDRLIVSRMTYLCEQARSSGTFDWKTHVVVETFRDGYVLRLLEIDDIKVLNTIRLEQFLSKQISYIERLVTHKKRHFFILEDPLKEIKAYLALLPTSKEFIDLFKCYQKDSLDLNNSDINQTDDYPEFFLLADLLYVNKESGERMFDLLDFLLKRPYSLTNLASRYTGSLITKLADVNVYFKLFKCLEELKLLQFAEEKSGSIVELKFKYELRIQSFKWKD